LNVSNENKKKELSKVEEFNNEIVENPEQFYHQTENYSICLYDTTSTKLRRFLAHFFSLEKTPVNTLPALLNLIKN